MKEISHFEGVYIFMDTNAHKFDKPHIHVELGPYNATLEICRGVESKLLEGSLPSYRLDMVNVWMRLRKISLLQNWNRSVRGEVLEKITPLR